MFYNGIKCTFVFFLLVSKFSIFFTTIDLNNQEILFVADHLSHNECRKLSEALHMHHWNLDHPVTGAHEPNQSCYQLIKHWDTHEGKGQTFHDLAQRLNQIGRRDLADKLSKTVYHEKSEAVRRNFLDDPFKKMIHQDSPMLEEAPRSEPESELTEDPGAWSSLHTVGVVLIGICMLIICVMLYIISPWKFQCKCCQPFWQEYRIQFYEKVIGMKPPKDENLFIFL